MFCQKLILIPKRDPTLFIPSVYVLSLSLSLKHKRLHTQIPDKHVPFLSLMDKTHIELKVRGTGGSETNLHPQTPDHYISKVWAVDEFSGEIVFFADISESKEASVVFEIPEGTETLLSYSYCNLHGLYEGDTFTIQRVEL